MLERELELLDVGNHDEELTGLQGNIQKLVETSKKEILEKKSTQKKKEVESKQKEEDAEYAYTPKEGFNWDNVSGAINDVIWTNGTLIIIYRHYLTIIDTRRVTSQT